MNAKLFYLVLSVFILSFLDSSAMICIKNGKGERYSTGFEPCRYYWDNVINNDGTGPDCCRHSEYLALRASRDW